MNRLFVALLCSIVAACGGIAVIDESGGLSTSHPGSSGATSSSSSSEGTVNSTVSSDGGAGGDATPPSVELVIEYQPSGDLQITPGTADQLYAFSLTAVEKKLVVKRLAFVLYLTEESDELCAIGVSEQDIFFSNLRLIEAEQGVIMGPVELKVGEGNLHGEVTFADSFLLSAGSPEELILWADVAPFAGDATPCEVGVTLIAPEEGDVVFVDNGEPLSSSQIFPQDNLVGESLAFPF